MTEQQARAIAAEIEKFCQEKEIWYAKTEEHKSGLEMIRFKELSIKITEKKGK